MKENAAALTPSSRSALKLILSSCLELTKPRLTLLAVLTTYLGYALAGGENGFPLVNALVGAFLVGGGVNALNQFFERELDAKMKRTVKRPLPSGRLNEEQAFNTGLILSVIGMMYLACFVNPAAGLVSFLIFGTYLFVYTPLKQKTPYCTLIGAVPGALPPVLGWASAEGRIPFEAWVLFSILFFWQMPHFFAIAWLYREDYGRAGFPMFPVTDQTGRETVKRGALYTVPMVLTSLLPAVTGMAGKFYFAGALLLGFSFAGLSAWFLAYRRPAAARAIFLASIAYLTFLVAFLLADRS